MWWIANLILLGLNKVLKTHLSAGPLGCRSNPVKCHGPDGEHAYLNRLRGPGGRRLLYQRLGSLLIPSPYGNIVDLYLIGYEEARPIRRVYMDMYFQGYIESRPIWGFHVEPAESHVSREKEGPFV